jgi:hypothetical protein
MLRTDTPVLSSQEPFEENHGFHAKISIPNIDFLITNDYSDISPLSGDYSWSNIVEPYRMSYLTVKRPVPGVRYWWYVDGEFVGRGENITMSFQEPSGETQLVVVKGYLINREKNVETSTSGFVQVSEGQREVMCKYVRREIRALLAQDRAAFFQAVSIMQRVPTAVGQSLYGSKYHSKDWFNRIHLYFGGARDCDHWHTVSRASCFFAYLHVTHFDRFPSLHRVLVS